MALPLPAHGSRVFVDLDTFCERLAGTFAPHALMNILTQVGFTPVSVDICAEARTMVGSSAYRRKCSPCHAPAEVDCSTLTGYLYGLIGISLPRLSIEQVEFGTKTESPSPGDLVFTRSSVKNDYRSPSAPAGIGHAGICVAPGRVVHAPSGNRGVLESPLAEFVRDKVLYARQVLPHGRATACLTIPEGMTVTSQDTVYWILTRHLHWECGIPDRVHWYFQGGT